jgi:hypothetical protein
MGDKTNAPTKVAVNANRCHGWWEDGAKDECWG